MIPDTLFTIGYSGFEVQAFVAKLRDYRISAVIDVRSQPHSSYFPQYNREVLAAALKEAGILYRNYAREFGARQTDPAFFSKDGYLNFERFRGSDAFREGFRRLKEGMAHGFSFALMCAEKDPMICHRAILVAKAFHEAGYRVVHLLPDGESTQEELEQRLLDRFFPDRAQISLFNAGQTEADYIRQAYERQNAEIGYRREMDWE